MKDQRFGSIQPRHAGLAALLLATLVAAWFAPEPVDEGDERQVAAPAVPAERTANAAGEASAEDRRQALEALDTDLIRQRHLGTASDDAFSRKSWYVAPPPVAAPAPAPVIEPPPPPPPPPPKAPPLPFKHLGKIVEAGKSVPMHYLMDGERMLIVSEGDVIGGRYRFVGQIGNQLQFIYLPLNERQNLPMSGTP